MAQVAADQLQTEPVVKRVPRPHVHHAPTFKEMFMESPGVYLGIVATGVGLSYGLRGLFTRNTKDQANGMAMRIGFQFCTVVVLVLTLGKAHQRSQYRKHLTEQVREERKEEKRQWEKDVAAGIHREPLHQLSVEELVEQRLKTTSSE